MRVPDSPDIESFHRAGTLGLRLLEAREGRGRRFGEAALAAWEALGGALEARDHLELLLRDAAVANPLAFAARSVFDRSWLTSDEPTGHDFPQPAPLVAAALLREAKAAPLAATSATATLTAAAEAWRLPALSVEPGLADRGARITAATRIVVSGPSAILFLATRAEAQPDLDLGEQVLLVTDRPAERHLYGLALLVTGSRGRPRVASSQQATAERARALGLPRVDLALVSEDAQADARDAITRISRELGG